MDITKLTARERDIFTLLGQGLDKRHIAESLRIAVKTVETHREAIKHKLGIDSARELVRLAVEATVNRGRESGMVTCPKCRGLILNEHLRCTGTFGGSAEVTAKCPACKRDVLFGFVDQWFLKR